MCNLEINREEATRISKKKDIGYGWKGFGKNEDGGKTSYRVV